MRPTDHTPAFDFSGGDLSLDFVNTLADRPGGRQDSLRAWADFAAWGAQAGLVPPRRTRPLERRGGLRRAITLRECLYRLFTAASSGEPPVGRDLDLFHRYLTRALSRTRLAPAGGQLPWKWGTARGDRDLALDAIVRAAAALLTSPDVSRVRECDAETCSWLFIDRSRGGRRRWCSMKTCGNRAKARRFYRRRSS